jgi:hypothetical protein
MSNRSTGRRVLFHAAWSAIVAFVALYVPIAEGLDNLYNIGSVTGELSGFIALCAGLLAFLTAATSVLVVGIQWIMKRRASRIGIAVAGYALVVMIFTYIGMHLTFWFKDMAELRLADRGRPLIAAVSAFVAEQGRPPDRLEDLKPRYIADLPRTGLSLYPQFGVVTCGTDTRNCLGDHWLIFAESRGGPYHVFGGCDRYIYAPSGGYPSPEVDTICHYGNVPGGWAYEYGD